MIFMANYEHDVGILIHQTPYSETSRIVTWLTLDNGILQTMAKGVNRKNSSLGIIDLFYECDLTLKLSLKSGLHALIHTRLIHNHGQALSSYAKQLTALYCYEVIEILVEKQTPIPEYYQLYLQALVYLKTHDTSWKLIERFERKALSFSGFNQPSISLNLLRQTSYHRSPKCLKALKTCLGIPLDL